MKYASRIISLLLVFCMVFAMMPAAVYAEETETVTETAPEMIPETIPETVPEMEPEAAAEAVPEEVPETQIGTQVIPFRVNPLYEGLYEPGLEDIPQIPEPEHITPQGVSYQSEADAAKTIRMNMTNRKETYTVYVYSTNSDYNALFAQLLNMAVEHTGVGTEGDYLMWQLAGWGGEVSYTVSGEGYNYTYTYVTPYYTTAAQETKVTTEVNKLINNLGIRNKSDYEKVCAVYDWLCDNVTYDYDNLEDTSYALKFTAYAALVDKTAVCQGYALLFYRLMLELGVDARFIGGEGDGGPHAWNIVQLGDYYYNLDSTWDAGYPSYEFFLLSTWNFLGHYRDPEFDTWEFHMAHPMAGEDYVHGGTATLDPIINMGACGTEENEYLNAIWIMMRDGTLVVEGEGAIMNYSTDGLPYWFYWIDHIEKAEIAEGITKVGDYAFYEATALKSVSLPESLTEIGDYAFAGSGLETVEIPAGVKKLRTKIFRNCDALTSITFHEGLTEIGSSTFEDCDALTDFSFPGTLTTIGYDAFHGCDSITELTIPETVTTLRDSFSGCVNLTKLTLNNTGRIGDSAFSNCSNLVNIHIGPNVTEIAGEAFYNCGSLREITIPSTVKNIGINAFKNCSALETAHLYNSGGIGQSAFQDCKKLKNVDFKNITYISDRAFRRCPIESITLPESLRGLATWAFVECSDLSEITFQGDAPSFSGNALSTITATAYYPANNATWTEDVMQDYGGNITWVPYNSYLASGTWGDNISWTLDFDGTLIVYGEGEVAENRNEPYPWKEYAEQIIRVIFEEGVTNVPVSAFEYYYPNLTSAELKSVEIIESTAFAQCTALTSITLPDTLTEIDNGAFSDAGLTTIDIHEGVTRIGMSAFSGSKLTEIVLPDGLLELGNGAFFWCENLKSAYLPDSITKVGMNLFTNCTALETANIPRNLTYVPESMFSGCSSLKSIEIPDGITAMYMNDFEGTALTTVTIPASVTLMGSAFMNCLELKEIVFEGDAPEMYNFCFMNVVATAYYPAGNETWTEEVMKDYGGTITWVPYEVEVTNFVKWYSGTTSLNGTIDLNIYVLLSDDLVNADDTYVRFTYAGKTVDVPMDDALYAPLDTAPNRYRFSCPIYAKQLTDAVNVKFMKGDAVIGSELNYSVVTYCKNRISKSTDPAEVAICKAMLNYGAASQQLFNYNTDNLANASLSDADKVLANVDASAYKYSVTGSEAGIKAKSATLMLEDVVKVRVYFTITGNKTIDEYTFTIDGKVVTPSYNDKGWYVETDGIAAKDLEKMFQVKVGGITVTYGALSFVNSKVNGSNTLESNISKALYAYWQAAEALLG